MSAVVGMSAVVEHSAVAEMSAVAERAIKAVRRRPSLSNSTIFYRHGALEDLMR